MSCPLWRRRNGENATESKRARLERCILAVVIEASGDGRWISRSMPMVKCISLGVPQTRYMGIGKCQEARLEVNTADGALRAEATAIKSGARGIQAYRGRRCGDSGCG